MPDGWEPDSTLQPVRPHGEDVAAADAGEPAETIATLERALARERAAREEAERLSRTLRDQVDDDLRAALDTCRQLEREKLAAFGLASPDDADVFDPDRPAAPVAAFTWKSLRENLEAEHRSELDRRDAELRDLTERHRLELERMARQGDALEARVRDHDDALRQASERQSSLEADVRRAAADQAKVETARAALAAELEEARAALALTRQHLDAVYASASWKASRPLRGIAGLFGRRDGPR